MEQLQPKARIVPEMIHLREVNITNAQVNASPGAEGGWDEVTLNMSSATMFNVEYLCRLNLVLDMEKLGEDGEPLIKANFSIDFDFEIENILDLIQIDEKTKLVTEVSYELGATLMAIVYSTARGIIMTRTAGTVLNGLILPVVNTAQLLETQNKKL